MAPLTDVHFQENEKYRKHYSCICSYQGKVNVMAAKEIEKGYEFFFQNHVLDVLRVLNLEISWTNKRIVDVGSGSGLPGIPLAIALENIVDSVHLIEATGKKVAFLEYVAKSLKLDCVSIIKERAEIIGHDKAYRAYFDIALSRAIGYIDECMELTLPLIKLGGYSFLYRGEVSQPDFVKSREVANKLGGKLLNIVNYHPSGFDKPRCIMVIQKTQKTDDMYPRTPGTPKKSSIFKE